MLTSSVTLTAALCFLGLAPAILAEPGGAGESSAPAESAATGSDSDPQQRYLLRYQFQLGEVMRTEVVHQASVRTTIEGTSQTAKTVSISVKAWQITDVDEDRVTFEHSVEYVDMKNDVTGRETVSYNSRTDNDPPPGFEEVSRRVGVPLTRITMDQSGKMLKREDLAVGATPPSQLALPLPQEKIAVGSTWTFPDDIVVQLQNGTSRKIKCRQRFELLAVEKGVASIKVVTQILTPIKDYPEIQAQLIQRESEGTIRFDLEAGRVIAQQIDLDRRVTGYPNAKSSMHYRTRFTETLLPDAERTAERSAGKPSSKN